MSRAHALAAVVLALALAGPAAAQGVAHDSLTTEDAVIDSIADPATPQAAAHGPRPLEALVPTVAANSWGVSDGVRPYRNRPSFSPGFGWLGNQRLFSFRLAYAPDDWLAYEAALEHNPAQSVHAVLHSLSAIVRHPFAGRLQPYAALGYGMFMVFPGRSINADPVTKNALTLGGGLEMFIRNDLALRGDLRRATMFGRQKDREGVVTYDYSEGTIGLVFYRSIAP